MPDAACSRGESSKLTNCHSAIFFFPQQDDEVVTEKDREELLATESLTGGNR